MIVVTGASGYVGNNLVRRLVALDQPVRALVRNRAKAVSRLADIADHVEIAVGDVTRPASLIPVLKDATAVVHLVAIAIEQGANTYERINTQGTINVVDAAEAVGVPRFINMSQNGATSASPFRFLASKGRAQEYVAQSDLDWTALRPSVIWGPQDEFANVQARLIKLIPLVFPLAGDGRATFQPVWVGDVVEAIVRCLDDDNTIDAEYALGGPEVLKYDEIVQRVLAALGTRRFTVHTPVALLRPLVKLMELALPRPPVSTALLDMLAIENVVEHNALTEVFGIEPRPFTPEHLGYMREFSAWGSLRRLFGAATADEPDVA